jgi:hypothetical protein
MTGIVTWPFMANAGSPMVEEYGYETDVIGSYRKLEQRMRLRRHPVGSYEFAFTLDQRDAQRANALLYRHHAHLWAVPLWHYAAKSTGNIFAGAMAVPLVTANVSFTDLLGFGSYALLWRSPQSFELLPLTAIYPSRIDFAAPTAGAWALNSYVIPVRQGRIDTSYGVAWETTQLVTGRIKFLFDAYNIGAPIPTYATDPAVTDTIIFGGVPQPVV